MKSLSDVSCKEYRSLIEKDAFISYFRKATPELVFAYSLHFVNVFN